MIKTLIGGGKSLDSIIIGLDTIVFNESKHWYRDPDTKRLYAKAEVIEQDGEYLIYMTGEAEKKIKRERYTKNVK